MLILKARQIRAARALLDWSQEDLAAASGLSVATIRKLELGTISPRGKTTNSLRHAFEDAGLEFLEPDGVRHRPDNITLFYGVEGFRLFYDDVYHTSTKRGGDIVVVIPSEEPFNQAFGDYQKVHYDRMIAIMDRVKVKCIVTENKENLPASYCEYRTISKHYVDSVPFYIYGDKFAIIDFETEPSPKITIIHSATIAKAYRRQFDSMWDKATHLKETSKTNISNKKNNKNA